MVGHSPLLSRGMNAGLAVWGDHVYVGSRTDGSPDHPNAGVLVVDVSDPATPRVVGEIVPPNEGNPGETSRELRIWPKQGLLVVLNFGCDPIAHACARRSVRPTIRFYDIRGSDANAPRLVTTYRPSATPHEMFLWQDPNDHRRALLFMSTPGDAGGSLLVADISDVHRGEVRDVVRWRAEFPDPGADTNLHSLSVSADGRVAYLAHLTRGFFMVDTSEVAMGTPNPTIRALTPLDQRVSWDGWGAHSAVPIPNRDLVLTTDEVYGRIEVGGCPWGWARIVDVSDPTRPTVASEYRVLPYNDPARCSEIASDTDDLASLSSHNPTVTQHLASWPGTALACKRSQPTIRRIPFRWPSSFPSHWTGWTPKTHP